jgi:hypothetical protein
MKAKPVTPYQRLLRQAQVFANKVQYRRKIGLWTYPKNKMNLRWDLSDLAERVAAAQQLGYEVQIENVEGSLKVYYVKKLPDEYFG